ncbi:hypothetical protein Q0F98_34720 [Paenibacillus amylolyticus]|nr:hypothetical protein Q0F98_34720 [Paenibacillus amylolyticus]
MLEDLTEVYDKYASELVKEFMSAEDGAGLKPGNEGWQNIRHGEFSRLAGFLGYDLDSSGLAEKVGLEAPKSMQDVIQIAEAFTFEDPDGNGKDDTYWHCLEQRFTYKCVLARLSWLSRNLD